MSQATILAELTAVASLPAGTDAERLAARDGVAGAIQHGIEASAGTVAPGPHHATHEAGGSDAITVTKAQVGLGNCDNTSDATKPVSAAQAAADAAAVATASADATAKANAAQAAAIAASDTLGSASAAQAAAIAAASADATAKANAAQAASQPVNGNLTAFAALTGAANKLAYFTGAGAMALATALTGWLQLLGSVKAAWDETNGYLGIGTVTPSTQVEIAAGVNLNANFRVCGNGQNYLFGFDVASGAAGHYLYGYGAKPIIFGVNGFACLTLANSASAGLGVHELAGSNLKLKAASGTANLQVQSGASSSLDLASSSTTHYVYGNGSKSLEIGTNGTKRIGVSATGAVDIVNALTLSADLILGKTIKVPGITGNQTIDKLSGRVNFAAGATSLVVTCNLATANSIIHATAATNDATGRVTAVVAAAGSFTIYATAPTAEMAVNFSLTN